VRHLREQVGLAELGEDPGVEAVVLDARGSDSLRAAGVDEDRCVAESP
jgi:hypothetical protein